MLFRSRLLSLPLLLSSPSPVDGPTRSLKPGGYIDVAEYEATLRSDDGTLAKSSSLLRYYALLNEAAAKIGQEFRIAENLVPFLQDAGFVGIHHQAVKLPLGTWPAEKKQKEIGAYVMLLTEDGFESYGMAFFTRVLEMPIKEVEELIKTAKKESRNRQIHSYWMQ